MIIYNLPRMNMLKLSMNNVFDIYNGKITFWNDSSLALLNLNIKLPNEKIKLLARQDVDDEHELFYRVLSRYMGRFNNTTAPVDQSTSEQGECCNNKTMFQKYLYMNVNTYVGMIGVTATVPFTIGYATLPELLEYDIKQAKLVSNGQVIKPSPETLSTMMEVLINTTGSDETNFDLQVANSATVYPLSGFTYLILNESYTNVDCCKVEELVGFIDWFLSEWSDKEVIDENFVPLINELQSRIRRTVLRKITCDGVLVYPKYVASKQTASSGMKLWELAVIFLVCFLVSAMAAFWVYKRKYMSDENRWIIDPKTIKIMKSLQLQMANNSELSLGSSTTGGRSAAVLLKFRMVEAEMDETKVLLDKLDVKIPKQWKTSTKRMVSKMKTNVNKNVLAFIGVTALSNEEVYLIFEHCSKGTLHYFLQSTRYNISNDIKYQFAIDVAQGMKYLHRTGIISGQLNSLTCYVDSAWMVKVAQWEQVSIYAKESSIAFSNLATYDENRNLEEEDLIKFLYMDPKLKNSLSENVDIFSFGLLLAEIFTQKLPYTEQVEEGLLSYNTLLRKKFCENEISSWMSKTVPANILTLGNACIGDETNRPNFQKICSQLKTLTKISSGITDIIMDAMDKHAELLEEKVEERTAALKQVQYTTVVQLLTKV